MQPQPGTLSLSKLPTTRQAKGQELPRQAWIRTVIVEALEAKGLWLASWLHAATPPLVHNTLKLAPARATLAWNGRHLLRGIHTSHETLEEVTKKAARLENA
jgi:hypothetical protein